MSEQLTKKEINQVYRRNLLGFQWGWNYEVMQGLGYTWVMMPVLRKLYGNKPEAMKRIVKMQMGYYNSQPAMTHLVVGADMALEEEMGEQAEEAVVGLKTGLMGPFASVGDTLFQAIYKSIVFSIAAYMALEGNAVGLLIPLLTGCGLIYIRYQLTWIGYKQGKRLALNFADSISPLAEAASILGLTVVGALVPSVISYRTDLAFQMGEVAFSIQEMLDKILPGLIPLAVVFFAYRLLGKKKVNSTGLIFILIALGMILGNLQNMLGFIVGLF